MGPLFITGVVSASLMLKNIFNALLEQHGSCSEPYVVNLAESRSGKKHPFISRSHLGCLKGCLLSSLSFFCKGLPRADNLLCRVLANSVVVLLFFLRVYWIDSALQRNIRFYLEEAVLQNENLSRVRYFLKCSPRQRMRSMEFGFESFYHSSPKAQSKKNSEAQAHTDSKESVHTNPFEEGRKKKSAVQHFSKLLNPQPDGLRGLKTCHSDFAMWTYLLTQ